MFWVFYILISEPDKPVNFYRAGVNECAWAVQNFLGNCDDVTPETRIRLLDHVASWVHHNSENRSPGGAFNPMAPHTHHSLVQNSNVTSTHRAFPQYLFQLLTNQTTEQDLRASSRVSSSMPQTTPKAHQDSIISPPSGGKSSKSRSHSQSTSMHPYHNTSPTWSRGPLVDRNNNCVPDTTTTLKLH